MATMIARVERIRTRALRHYYARPSAIRLARMARLAALHLSFARRVSQ